MVNFLPTIFIVAQTPINSITTSGYTETQVSYINRKGAGLRHDNGNLISSWDSVNSYTVNFNAPAARNHLRLDQFYVNGISGPFITVPLPGAIVKLRRNRNTAVTDSRNYFNFWAEYSSIPATSDVSGTFNYIAKEVLNPEDAFKLNNLNSGYDNIFSNLKTSAHFANIERVDYIIPSGLKPTNDVDRTQSGITIIDRGVGDPLKVAAILALDGNNVPTLFGNMVQIQVTHFGPNLLAANLNYSILINDVNYKSESRPSTASNQNLKGVYVSLSDMGIAINQVFYGYALFGNDVTMAKPDWTDTTAYPTNSGGSILDPVNVMGMFKSVNSVLTIPAEFIANKVGKKTKLSFSFLNKNNVEQIIVERSNDGIHFKELSRIPVQNSLSYSYTDDKPLKGKNFYRFRFSEPGGESNLTDTKMIEFDDEFSIKLFPNPINNVLQIRLPSYLFQKQLTAEIWNFNGKQVLKYQFVNKREIEEIDVSQLPKGIYQLSLSENQFGENIFFTSRFIK